GQIKAALGGPAFAQLIKPQTAGDLAFLSTTGPHKLGAANFAALTNPNPQLGAALKTLSVHGPPVQKAASASPKQWRTYFFVGVGGEIVFIPLILLMAGFWDPRKAKRAEEEHDRWLAAEMAKLEH
ncbi:MAG: MFS transporter, partial [Solirubrobacteraceae bacterium]